MPQQRKPLIDADILPVPAPGVMDRILDRQRPKSVEASATDDGEVVTDASSGVATDAHIEPVLPAVRPGHRGRRVAPEVQALRLIEQAKKRGETIVTNRVPKDFDDYAETYVSRIRRTAEGARYRKQDVYAEALAAWIIAHPLPPDPIDQSIFGPTDDES